MKNSKYRSKIKNLVLLLFLSQTTQTSAISQGSHINVQQQAGAFNLAQILGKTKHDLIETESEDQVVQEQEMDPAKMTTEQLQKMLAELQGVQAGTTKDTATLPIPAAEPLPEQTQAVETTEDAAQESFSGNKAELKAHQEKVRNEGLSAIPYLKNHPKLQITLEIDDEGAAKGFAEEGAPTMKDDLEFQKLQAQLKQARGEAKNKLGQGGFFIALQKPSKFHDNISMVMMPDPTDEKSVVVQKFNTQDQSEAQGATDSQAAIFQSETGSTIINDKLSGKENVLVNGQTDPVKYNSYVSAGYSIRNNLIQKMAPGDSQFHTVNFQPNNQVNGYRSFPTHDTGVAHFNEIGDMPKLLISGETGDVLMANGSQIEIDECLGNFYTQRQYLKFYGQS